MASSNSLHQKHPMVSHHINLGDVAGVALCDTRYQRLDRVTADNLAYNATRHHEACKPSHLQANTEAEQNGTVSPSTMSNQLNTNSHASNYRTSKVKPLRIGVVAGEVSGDALGAKLMQDINRLHPRVEWHGVGGSQMQAQGLHSCIDMSRLAVMGLVEVIKHLPDLLRAKEQILNVFNHHHIDIFIGIDAPDFNLRLGHVLKSKGVYSVQYVSPSVWAWREKRIHKIMAATDLVLCLFPFELSVYQKYNHPAVCVGHPLLDAIKRPRDMLATRRDLVWRINTLKDSFLKRKVTSVVGLLPGSRAGEISKIAPPMFAAVLQMLKSDPNLHFLVPAASQDGAKQLGVLLAKCDANVQQAVDVIFENKQDFSQEVMAACDALLLASGTVTFEAMLLSRPMVVVYKLNAMTYALARRLVKLEQYSLPNILANTNNGSHSANQAQIVPELIQEAATPEAIAQHTLDLLDETNAANQVAALKKVSTAVREKSAVNSGAAVLSEFFYKN